MFKVPFYSFQNYQTIIGKHYDEQNVDERVDLKDFVALLTPEFVAEYAQVDARGLGNYLEYSNLSEMIEFAGKFRSLEEVLVASKLLMPTLWTCDYFLWNQGDGVHTGVDMVLPKGTPIMSISDGKIVRVKEWDGRSKDEGNCVVVQSGAYYFAYKHLDRVQVEYGQVLAPSTEIGLCGSSGNATQYHLHLQVDNNYASFHPYWSSQQNNVQKNTEDPLLFLRKLFDEFDVFYDMPQEENYRNAIHNLFQKGIIQGVDNKIFPNQRIQRWWVALFVDKLAQKYALYSKLPIYSHHYVSYSDELEYDALGRIDALKNLQRYAIMVGDQGKFFPFKDLKGEERLAILGRLFFRLQDAEEGEWFDSYIHYFQEHNIVDTNWSFVGYYLDRKEAFEVLDRVLSFSEV